MGIYVSSPICSNFILSLENDTFTTFDLYWSYDAYCDCLTLKRWFMLIFPASTITNSFAGLTKMLLNKANSECCSQNLRRNPKGWTHHNYVIIPSLNPWKTKNWFLKYLLFTNISIHSSLICFWHAYWIHSRENFFIMVPLSRNSLPQGLHSDAIVSTLKIKLKIYLILQGLS